jgi:hypothetical protein
MHAQIMVIAGDVGVEAAGLSHSWAQALADRLNQPVDYGRADPEAVAAALAAGEVRITFAALDPAAPLPMSSAEFIYLADGRPDWGAMWQGFCELALFGGPPHRGEDSALLHTDDLRKLAEDFDAIGEIRRGIFETTGMYSEPSVVAGWLDVTCESPKMAAWMAACILLENVDARFDEERLLVPASPSFTLKNEVKSVITVVAKVHHYWMQHVAAAEAQAARAAQAS